MLNDSKRQPPLYLPCSYWATKAKNAAKGIKRWGMADFRGPSNNIGLSYADNMHIDNQNAYNHGLRRLAMWLTKIYPLSKISESQAQWIE